MVSDISIQSECRGVCICGLQVPSAPGNLSVVQFSGDGTALLVAFDPPNLSADRNKHTTRYTVQWSTSTHFSSYRSLEYSGLQCSPITVTVTTGSGKADISGGSFRLAVSKRDMSDTTDAIAFDAAAQIDDALQQRLPGNVTMQSRLQQLRNVDYVAVSRQSLGRGRFVWMITFLDEDDADDAVKVAVMSSDLVPYRAAVTLSHGWSTRQSKVISGIVPRGSHYVRVFASNENGLSPASTTRHQYLPGPPRRVIVSSYNSTALHVLFSAPEDDGDPSLSYLYVNIGLRLVGFAGPQSPWRRFLLAVTISLAGMLVHALIGSSTGQVTAGR